MSTNEPSKTTFFRNLVALFKAAWPGKSSNPQIRISSFIEWGKQQGLVGKMEDKMLRGIFDLRDTVVREVMAPRTEVVAIDCESSVGKAAQAMVSSGHSRIPAYRQGIDNIVGMIYAKDILRCWSDDKQVKVSQVMRPAYFVPETKNTLELLEEFKKRRSPIAVVVDEYGGTSGLVTIEDLLEELVGEIRDEHDQAEEPFIKELQPGIFLVDARMNIEELEETLGLTIPREDFDTVGGLVFHVAGRVPKVGDQLYCPPLKIRVEQADERRVARVIVEKLEEETSAPGEGGA